MRILTLVVLTLSPCTFLCADSLFSGTVTDSLGTPIAGSIVSIHWDSAGSTVGLRSNVGIKKDITIQTGAHGGFSLMLPPGFYDVFVSSMAFTPTCRKVRIRDGSDFSFHPQLPADPLITEELGDKFYSK